MSTSFSIVMPAYNVGLFIKESIECVLAQTYPNYELIIVDDGSKDNTFEVISCFDDSRIKVIRQENKGLGAARNVGIKNCSNEYIAFLDSDDLWTVDKLQNVVNNLEENVGVYYSNALEFKSTIDHAIPNRYAEPIKNISKNDLILIYDYIVVSSSVVPRKILQEFSGFSEEFNGTEDWDLWIRISRKYNFKKIESYDCYYRINPNGLSKNRVVFLEKEYKVIKKHLIDGNLGNPRIRKLSLWVWYKKNFYYYVLKFNLPMAIQFFCKMIILRPFSIHNFDFISRIFKKMLAFL